MVSGKYSGISLTTPIIKRIAHIDACTEASTLSAPLAAGGGSPPSQRSCGGSEEISPNSEKCVCVCACAGGKLSRCTTCANIHTFYMTSGPHKRQCSSALATSHAACAHVWQEMGTLCPRPCQGTVP